MIGFCWFGNGAGIDAGAAGVPRREVEGLKKSSGVSFQLLMFVALDGGGTAGDAFMFLGGPGGGAPNDGGGGIMWRPGGG